MVRETEWKRNRRDIPAGLQEAGVVIGQAASLAIDNASKCAHKGGCYYGSCWAYCGIDLSHGDWCYTTRSHSQSYDYVGCTRDTDCDLCWKCGGPCTLF